MRLGSAAAIPSTPASVSAVSTLMPFRLRDKKRVFPNVLSRRRISRNTHSLRPSGSRPPQRPIWYSLAHGISAHQPFTPDFSNIFHNPAMNNTSLAMSAQDVVLKYRVRKNPRKPVLPVMPMQSTPVCVQNTGGIRRTCSRFDSPIQYPCRRPVFRPGQAGGTGSIGDHPWKRFAAGTRPAAAAKPYTTRTSRSAAATSRAWPGRCGTGRRAAAGSSTTRRGCARRTR